MAGSDFTLLGEQAKTKNPNPNKNTAVLNIMVALNRSTKLPHNNNKKPPIKGVF
jgi:hypothetical protein